jgi:hypothetical protein
MKGEVMARTIAILITVLAVVVAACTSSEPVDESPSPTTTAAAREGVFTTEAPTTTEAVSDTVPLNLWVSNQSSSIDPVRLIVWVDDEMVADQDFAMGSGHTNILFLVRLASGDHTLRVTADDAGAELVRTFNMQGERWALVNFWTEDTNSISFTIQDDPILIR